MIDPGKAVKESSAPPPTVPAGKKLVAAIIFGTTFGFLLQKGGVGKYNVLIGQNLLKIIALAALPIIAMTAEAKEQPTHQMHKVVSEPTSIT